MELFNLNLKRKLKDNIKTKTTIHKLSYEARTPC